MGGGASKGLRRVRQSRRRGGQAEPPGEDRAAAGARNRGGRSRRRGRLRRRTLTRFSLPNEIGLDRAYGKKIL